jgi:hypothetical protein
MAPKKPAPTGRQVTLGRKPLLLISSPRGLRPGVSCRPFGACVLLACLTQRLRVGLLHVAPLGLKANITHRGISLSIVRGAIHVAPPELCEGRGYQPHPSNSHGVSLRRSLATMNQPWRILKWYGFRS